MTTNVLILCTHNSARSVLAEGMLNHWAQRLDRGVRAFSAGGSPGGRINPFALETLGNAGVENTRFRSKSWGEFTHDGSPPLDIVKLTRQALGYRMLQLLSLPFETMNRSALQAALVQIGRS